MNLKAFIKKILRLDLEKDYVSNIDKFLQEYDEKHPEKSLSQQQEIKKYQRIFQLRDNPKHEEKKSKIWEQF